MLADINMVLVQFAVEHVDSIRGLRTQSRRVLERVNGKVKAAHLVEDNHVERSGGCAHIIKSAHVEAGLVRSAMHHAVNEPAISMEREYNIDIACKYRVKRNIVHAVRMIVRAHQSV